MHFYQFSRVQSVKFTIFGHLNQFYCPTYILICKFFYSFILFAEVKNQLFLNKTPKKFFLIQFCFVFLVKEDLEAKDK